MSRAFRPEPVFAEGNGGEIFWAGGDESGGVEVDMERQYVSEWSG